MNRLIKVFVIALFSSSIVYLYQASYKPEVWTRDPNETAWIVCISTAFTWYFGH